MTDQEQREAALRQADEMRIEAAKMEQLGWAYLAADFRKNADAALLWASGDRK